MGRDGTASGAAKCVGVCSGSSDCLGLIILHVGNNANATGSHANITICVLSPPPAPSAHTRHRNGAVSALGAFFGRRRLSSAASVLLLHAFPIFHLPLF